MLDKAKEKNVKIILPTDFVCGDDFKADAKVSNATLESGIPDNAMGLDIGPKSIQAFQEVLFIHDIFFCVYFLFYYKNNALIHNVHITKKVAELRNFKKKIQ